MAKLIGGETAWPIAVYNSTGAGYMHEYEISRVWRDMRLITIGGGTSELMREILTKVQGLGRR